MSTEANLARVLASWQAGLVVRQCSSKGAKAAACLLWGQIREHRIDQGLVAVGLQVLFLAAVLLQMNCTEAGSLVASCQGRLEAAAYLHRQRAPQKVPRHGGGEILWLAQISE